jgi:hypothetical protein
MLDERIESYSRAVQDTKLAEVKEVGEEEVMWSVDGGGSGAGFGRREGGYFN